MKRPVSERMETLCERLESLDRTALFLAPARLLRDLNQTLDRSAEDLERAANRLLDWNAHAVQSASARLDSLNPANKIARSLDELMAASGRMQAACRLSALDVRGKLEKGRAVLEALNPAAALARGFSMTLAADGKPVRSAASLREGDIILTRFQDGGVRSVVKAES